MRIIEQANRSKYPRVEEDEYDPELEAYYVMAITLFDQEASTFPFTEADVGVKLDKDADYYPIFYDLDGGDEIGSEISGESSSTMAAPPAPPPLTNQPALPQKKSIVERVVRNAQAVCAREMASAVMETVSVAQIARITVTRKCKNLKLVVVLMNLSGLWDHSRHPHMMVNLLLFF